MSQKTEKNYLDVLFGVLNVLFAISWYPRPLQIMAPAFFALFCLLLYGITKFLSNKLRKKINDNLDTSSSYYVSILHIILITILVITS
jgi:ABC-type bacteriocin/lantibiotic exporter with double-glycine peptidase domain